MKKLKLTVEIMAPRPQAMSDLLHRLAQYIEVEPEITVTINKEWVNEEEG